MQPVADQFSLLILVFVLMSYVARKEVVLYSNATGPVKLGRLLG